MQTVKTDLPRNLLSAEIHTFSDWHIGDKHCDMALIKSLVNHIQNKDNAYCILNGDLMNNATTASVSDTYAENLPPMEQLEQICELINPIKNKVLFVSQGNHESRTYRSDGIDLTAVMCKELGIYDKYAREGGVLFLRLGSAHNNHGDKKRQVAYSFYITHGSGGGKRIGGKANRLEDMAGIVNTDIYIHAHTHAPVIFKQNYYNIDYQNSAVAECEKLFVNTAATLNYGGYGQVYEFKPSNKTTPIIYLDGRVKKFTAML